MRVTIRPVLDPAQEIDVTDRLVAAIAGELWRLYGGNDKLNWLEAELHLQTIVEQARTLAEQEQEVASEMVGAELHLVPVVGRVARPGRKRGRARARLPRGARARRLGRGGASVAA
jgi:hypothetical protein